MDFTFGNERVVMSRIDKNRPNGLASALNIISRSLIILLILVTSTVEGREGEICVVETPLYSPYFIPYIETPNPCDGCSYEIHGSSTSSGATAVHVIQMENVVDSVLTFNIGFYNELDGDQRTYSDSLLNDSEVYVFVITSSEQFPVSIVIHTEIANVTFKFLTRPQDNLYYSGSSSKHSVSSRIWTSPEEAIEGTKKEFGFISSFSRAKHVNNILFDLGAEVLPTDDCSIHTNEETSVAQCSLVIKKQTSGCFHDHMLGYGSSDIHIIDIDSEFGNDSYRKITLHVTDTEDEIHSRTVSPVKRNLTLVLRTTRPTLWSIKVSNIQGFITLYVADGGQVENNSCQGVSISVNRIDLPKTFDQTILRVLATIGPLVSYTRTEAPSIIQLVIPSNKKPKMTNSESNLASTDIVHTENANNLLITWFSYECYAGDVTLALPLWVERRVGGVIVTLRDRACHSFNNGTHLVLRSNFSRCGFVQDDYTNYFLYTNLATLEFGRGHLSLTDDEDFEGSGFEHNAYERKVTKMIKCKSNLKMKHMTTLESLEKHLEYRLWVYRDENFLERIEKFPVTVSSDTTIYAKVEFSKEPSKAPDLKILIEQCSLRSSSFYISSPVTLVEKSCSHQPYVTIKKSYISTNVIFHFLLSLETVPSRKVYLHCQIGVCTDDPLPQLGLNKCVMPGSYCTDNNLLRAFDTQVSASMIDTIVVGPFEVQRAEDDISSVMRNLGPSGTHEMLGSGATKDHIVVMEGLSTEIVVGIAIVSFVIGVCLTATLWIIYLQTDPRRQTRPESALPRNSGYDISGHSGSSTPSSQAPMTTA